MPSTLHGGLPPPGVWDKEGWALRRRTDERITADFITSHDGALEADFMYTNTYFSNGGHEKPNYVAKELHLSSSLVPLAPPPGPAPQPRSPSLSPPKRASAVNFDWVGASLNTSPSHDLPRAQLGASQSSPLLPRYTGEYAGAQTLYHPPGRQSVPMYSQSRQRALEADNWELNHHRAHSMVQERKRGIQEDLSRDGDWGSRWGFAHRTNSDDIRSRRRVDPTYSKPSLVGYQV